MMHETTLRSAAATSILAVLLFLAAPASAQEGGEDAPPKLWKKSLAVSALVTSGNSETTSAGLNLAAKRRPTPWGVAFKASALREESDDVVTADRYAAGVRVERAFGERWSAFGSLRGERDEPAGYELRSVAELGGLYNVLTGPEHELATRLGLTYTREDAVAVQNGDDSEGFLGAVLGADWTWKVREGSSLTGALELFPNFDASDDWRATAGLAYQSELSRLLALQVGYDVRYDNRPFVDARGRELDSTDTALTLSLVLGDRE